MASWVVALLLASTIGASPDCVLVEFSADWCRPCQQLQPTMERLTSEGWVVRQVNVDREPELTKRYKIQSLPTVVVIHRGNEVDRLVGAASYEQMIKRITAACAESLQLDDGRNKQPAVNSLRSAPEPPLARNQNSIQNAGTNRPPLLTVRGQSPAIAAFPMLASAANFASLASSASVQPGKVQVVQPNSLNLANNIDRQNVPVMFDQAVARARDATVRIRIEDDHSQSFGTGTIVDMHGDEALVLTCGHMFRDMKPGSALVVELFSGGHSIAIPAQVIDFDAPDNTQSASQKPDIGLISFRTNHRLVPVAIVPSSDPPVMGQPVYSFGCDRGADPTRRDSQIKHINRYLGPANIEISGAPVVGRSGGGLFDHQGRLIGVCNAADSNDDEGIYAGPVVVYSQLQKLGLNRLIDGSNQNNASLQLVSQATPNSAADSQWPDQDARMNPGITGNSPQSMPQPANTGQLICIVKEPNGQERVVTINAPSRDLIENIQRQAAARESTWK